MPRRILRIAAVSVMPLTVLLTGCPGDATPTTPQQPAAVTAPALTPAPQQATPTPAQQTASAQATAQHDRAVQALIAKAEASYKSGVANYSANRLDAARLDFDAAVDTMLSSGMDLKNDPALADEFDRLLSAINSLEMAALKQGNGFSPATEDAPVDTAEEMTFPPADPALLGRVTQQIQTTQSDLPLTVNDFVAGWITYFTNSPAGHAHLKRSLERAGRYKEMISRVLRENGVPQDLIYQAVAESGFQPQVVNRRSGAGGMWQFMPFSSYGLVRNGYVDERFDPVKSTEAYAKYIKSLYAQFGDWYLAMAAYDWGPGNIQKVVARSGYADYFELAKRGYMPGETKAYVPGIVAAVIMSKNPQQYGLTDLSPDPPVLFDSVTTDYAINLPLVADVTNTTVQEIVALNPALLRLSTPPEANYDLRLPPGTKDLFLDRIKDVPVEHRASWRFRVVKNGEGLEQIAAAFHARPAEIATYNKVTADQPLKPGDELIIPVQAVAALRTQTYTARRGDTLISIADRFGVTAAQLRTWNHMKTAAVAPGRKLTVSEPVKLAPHTRSGRSKGKASHAAHSKTAARRKKR